MDLRCPYCLNETRPELKPGIGYCCGECQEALPKDYVDPLNSRARIGLVGFTGHGKTVYLTSLFYTLRVLSNRDIWRNFSWRTCDDHTHKIKYSDVRNFENSRLPASTPENFPRPALIHLQNVPSMGDIFLSFYDTAGRVYESAEKITDMGRFVAHADTVFFLISLSESGLGECDMGDVSFEMERLLDIYIRGVYEKMHVDLSDKQEMVVLLTKADEIDILPEDLHNFLNESSCNWWMNDDLEARFSALDNYSERIREWLRSEGCGGFVNLAENNFKGVKYTLISSTGASPVGDTLVTKLEPEHPKGVINPLVFAMRSACSRESAQGVRSFIGKIRRR